MRTAKTELSEVLNGRLAMFACVGIWSTWAVNHETPLQSLGRHLADPAHNNGESTQHEQQHADGQWDSERLGYMCSRAIMTPQTRWHVVPLVPKLLEVLPLLHHDAA